MIIIIEFVPVIWLGILIGLGTLIELEPLIEFEPLIGFGPLVGVGHLIGFGLLIWLGSLIELELLIGLEPLIKFSAATQHIYDAKMNVKSVGFLYFFYDNTDKNKVDKDDDASIEFDSNTASTQIVTCCSNH